MQGASLTGVKSCNPTLFLLEYLGAVYHVTGCRNERQDVFLDAADRIAFLDLVHQTCERFNWLCHAYCLMTNHYHLLVGTIEPPHFLAVCGS